MTRMLPIAFLAVLIVGALSAIALSEKALEIWEYVHDKLRAERKEDESDG